MESVLRSTPNASFVGRSGRDHAEPSVVIDVASAESHAREFTEQVRLLSRERGAAVNGHGILAIVLLDLAQPAAR